MAIDFSAPTAKVKKSGLPIQKPSSNVLDLEGAKKKFQPYLEKIEEVTKDAQALQVDTDETNKKAVEIGTSAKTLLKRIEEARIQAIMEPYNFVKSVNAFVKIFSDKLSAIETLTKEKRDQYRAYQEQKRRETEAAAKKAMEEAQKKLNEDAKNKGIEPVHLDMPIIPKQETITRTETGTAYDVKHWTFEVIEPHYVRQLITDLNIQWEKGVDSRENHILFEKILTQLKALASYLVLSETEIRNAVKGGIRQIPGIKIFEKIETRYRT